LPAAAVSRDELDAVLTFQLFWVMVSIC